MITAEDLYRLASGEVSTPLLELVLGVRAREASFLAAMATRARALEDANVRAAQEFLAEASRQSSNADVRQSVIEARRRFMAAYGIAEAAGDEQRLDVLRAYLTGCHTFLGNSRLASFYSSEVLSRSDAANDGDH